MTLSAALACQRGAAAEGRSYRVGYFGTLPTDYLYSALRAGLEEHGYVEGRNLELIYRRYLQGGSESIDEVAAKLIASNPDVIVSGQTPPTVALRKLTSSIPIVMVTVSNAIASRLIESVSRPGGNVTGFDNNLEQAVSKQIEIAKELFPTKKRMGVVINAETKTKLAADSFEMSRKLGFKSVPLFVAKPDEYDVIFDNAGIELALIVSDGMAFAHRAKIASAAARHSLPTISSYREEAQAGSLAAYGADVHELFRRSAVYVDKILKGAQPATLPVEYPSRYRFVLNLKTATALGLTISPSVLARADEVID